MNEPTLRSQAALGLLWYLTLAAAALALIPGIAGTFAIDDFPNLEGLELISAAPGAATFLEYVLNGISSPLGRPLALATFALQHHSWPHHPGDFIQVNVLLHLLNACLVFWICLRLIDMARQPDRPIPRFAALAAAWLWLFAALQASAVLYVVQRMTVLSGTFVLLGLLMYLAGRRRELSGGSRGAVALMASGLAVGTGLGYLAKETAALLPLLILCLEYTLLADLPRSRRWRILAVALLWLPSAVVVAKLLSYIPGFDPAHFLRPFTLYERLLTEARVLFIYLQKFLLPPLYGMRLYYDDLEVSRSFLLPWTTAPAVLGLVALLGLALRYRRAAPAFSFAVLWFLAAHLLEATFIPLEIAFEHRNYVALLGPAFALSWYGARLLSAPVVRRVRVILVPAAALYGLYFAFSLWQAAMLWGQPWELAHYWAEQQPGSRRAQMVAPKLYWRLRMPERAIEVAENALQRWPGDVSFFLGTLETACAYPKLPRPDLTRIPAIVKAFDSTMPATVGMLDTLVAMAEDKTCHRYSPTELWAIVEMVFETPKLAPQRHNRLLLLSRIADLANDRPLARSLLDQAIAARRPSPVWLQRAATYALMDRDLACARAYLERFERTPMSRLHRWSFRDEFAELQDVYDELAAATGQHQDDTGACPGVAGRPS